MYYVLFDGYESFKTVCNIMFNTYILLNAVIKKGRYG